MTVESPRQGFARWPLGIAAGLACSSLLGAARADLPSDASVVVPPHLETPVQIAYPPGAKGDASVVLILTIEKTGAVRLAEVETGQEPFAQAAKEVAGALHFAPATRAHRTRRSQDPLRRHLQGAAAPAGGTSRARGAACPACADSSRRAKGFGAEGAHRDHHPGREAAAVGHLDVACGGPSVTRHVR